MHNLQSCCLYNYECAKIYTIIIVQIIAQLYNHESFMHFSYTYDCAIWTIMTVQFAQSSLCNLYNHDCAICTITIVQYIIFIKIIGLHLQNFTSVYNSLLLVYHDYIDDCKIMIFQIKAFLCHYKNMSKFLNVSDCIIFHLLKMYIYSMHIWLYNHLKIMIAQSFM